MSNVDAVKALLNAIHLDRFDEIEASHLPGATLWPFLSAPVRGSVEIQDWYTEFLRSYADCTYADAEFIEDGETVAVRATIEAKGYNWREFNQRVVDVCEMNDGLVAQRRLYAMLPDIELDKPATAAMNNALGYKGGSPEETRKLFEGLAAAVAANDNDRARSFYDEKAVVIDGVYGLGTGFDAIMALRDARPRPAFGIERVTAAHFGAHDALIEEAIDPARPRRAEWLRIVDGKIMVVEVYWMLREIGISPDREKRHLRRVIHPM